MKYIEAFYYNPVEQLILEPEDWSKDEWATICKVFGMEEAERIVISDYTIKAYGTRKENKDV